MSKDKYRKFKFDTNYTPSKKDKEYLTWWHEQMRNIDSFRSDRVKQWEDNEKRTYDRLITPVQDSDSDSSEAIRQPLEFAISEAKLANLIQKPPKVNLTAVNKQYKVHEDLNKHTLEVKMGEADFSTTLPEAMLKTINSGEAFVKASWVKTYEDFLTFKKIKKGNILEMYSEENLDESKKKEQFIKYNGLCYEIIDGKDVFLSEGCEQISTPHGKREAKFISIRYKIRFDEWRASYADNGVFKNVEAVFPKPYSETDYLSYSNDEESKISSGEWVIMYETYDVLNKNITYISNGVINYKGYFSISRPPLVMLKNIPIPGRLYSKGDPEVLRGLIGMSNSLFNKAELQADLSTNPPIVVGHGINADDIQTGAGAIIEARGGSVKDSVEFIKFPDISQGVQYMLDYIKNSITYTSGINLDVLNSQKGQTAFGIAMQQEQTLIRLGLFVRYNEQHGIKDLYEISLELMQKFLPIKEWELINSGDESILKETFPSIKIKGHKTTLTSNDDTEYIKVSESKGSESNVEALPEFYSGMKFGVEVIPGTMRDDMMLVKMEKLSRIITNLATVPKWQERMSEDIPDYLVEASGLSTAKMLKQPESEGQESEDQDIKAGASDLEKEWVALSTTDVPVKDIVQDSGSGKNHVVFLMKKLQETPDMSPKYTSRVREAISFYAKSDQGKLSTPESMQVGQGAEQLQAQPTATPVSAPESMQVGQGAEQLQAQPTATPVSAPQPKSDSGPGGADSQIRKNAQELSKGLNPYN